MKKIVVLCGPTAVGKTKVALDLAEKCNAEIVSADSGQVWKELDIGTGKPTPADQKRVRHHLIDVVKPDEHFDVARYVELADQAIADIQQRGKLPLIVGGTGMYIKILLHGLCEAPAQDKALRKILEERIAKEGLPILFEELKKVDPETAQKIHSNDTTRVIRALEVYEISGLPLSYFHKEHGFKEPRYQALQIGLTCEKKILHQRIEKRVDWMIASGWTEEVRELFRFYSADMQSIRATLGYPQITAHLRGQISLEEAAAEIKKLTRQYAKRQMTWFRADKNIRWVEATTFQDATELAGLCNSI
ncbi:MAG: tRNA (adenosine(37)-N6)-dimethylallyltransferase MiaA [Deltaproteobacteria bacterium]|nr:tRNA (adenosine(37)-N6)-dimethylallyltransferase MiaA [Deltaproteobacteria bacterium]